MKPTLLHVVIFFFLIGSAEAQRGCLTGKYYEALVKRHPKIIPYYGVVSDQPIEIDAARVYTVSVAAHVVWKTDEERISRETILRQIQILNDHFSGKNPDVGNTPKEFEHLLAGDIKIRFRLDTVTYTQTANDIFWMYISDFDSINADNQPIKFFEKGGSDGFAATSYLNIWVGNIANGNDPDNMLCGYATYPGGPDEFDGAVIHYMCFGTPGYTTRFDQGKTATHEIAHWLNLKHLWGDGSMNSEKCTDDFIRDTPKQDGCNVGRPVFPVENCDGNKNGDLFMNYMDYVDDSSMVMFSKKQGEHMRRSFKDFPQRAELLRTRQKIKNLFDYPLTDSLLVEIPRIRDLLERNLKTIIEWDSLPQFENLTVYVRALGEDKWEKLKRVNSNGVEISGLKQGELYQLKIDVLAGKQKIAETTPYLFIAGPGAPEDRGKIKINQIE